MGPNTNTAHFSIMMNPAPHLDGHYTIFGKLRAFGVGICALRCFTAARLVSAQCVVQAVCAWPFATNPPCPCHRLPAQAASCNNMHVQNMWQNYLPPCRLVQAKWCPASTL